MVLGPAFAARHCDAVAVKLYVLPAQRGRLTLTHPGVSEQFHKVSAVPGSGLTGWPSIGCADRRDELLESFA